MHTAPGPNFDRKVFHWGRPWIFSKLMKDTEIGIYWWNLIVSFWGYGVDNNILTYHG